MAGDEHSQENQENALKQALSKYEEAWLSGNRLDVEAFCKKHAECGPELRKKIEDFIYVVSNFPGKAVEEGGGSSHRDDESEANSGKILGDFRIIQEIGRGGMGTVYEAEQVSLKRKVALKVLPSHLSFSSQAVLKFQREAEAGGRQRHPGIVSVFAVGEHDGTHYIAQELVEGGFTLADKLESLSSTEDLPKGYFRDVAGLIYEVGEALEHAHDSGVIHRDIKPSNILLTQEGRPKVTDFGLARIEDALALSRTGDFAGTPYYMSPEQVMSRRMGIDRRTDIYSLGVTLYEMITLKRPFEDENTHEVLKKIMLTDPVDPHKANPRVPSDLSVICMKAMEKDPDRRYQSMAVFSEDLGRFLSGDVILAKPSGASTRLWKRVKRNPLVSGAVCVALLALLALVIMTPLYVWRITEKSNEAEEARKDAEAEKLNAIAAQIESEENYKQIVRLSDIKILTQLIEKAKGLWPAFPDMIPVMEAWIEEAEDLASRLDSHRVRLETLQRQEVSPEDNETLWQIDIISELVAGVESLIDEEAGTLKNVRDRIAFASTIRQRSIDDHQEAWDQAIEAIADREASPHYEGLVIEPQVGLVPIGPGPDSKLWEFAHLQTGEIPDRGVDGKIKITEEMGLVFVLVPGGTFSMGAMKPDDEHPVGSPNVDSKAFDDQVPVHSVTVEPFLLSKFEMTQAQWLRFTGNNPSSYGPGLTFGENKTTLLHPVEQVSWNRCNEVLFQLKLRFPSESEWEYAARAGTTTVWWTGDDKRSLEGALNMLDLYQKEHDGPKIWTYEEWLDDGYATTAPVGNYQPNPFGLCDVYGNVFEWCQDCYRTNYELAPTDGSAYEIEVTSVRRIYRGGAHCFRSAGCTSAYRGNGLATGKGHYIGLRPACSLEGQT
jgi:formylglycine-generating enzyme required for sulfatase activity